MVLGQATFLQGGFSLLPIGMENQGIGVSLSVGADINQGVGATFSSG